MTSSVLKERSAADSQFRTISKELGFTEAPPLELDRYSAEALARKSPSQRAPKPPLFDRICAVLGVQIPPSTPKPNRSKS